MTEPNQTTVLQPHPGKRAFADIMHSGLTAWVVLAISLAITVVAWRLSDSFAQQRAAERFQFQVAEAQFAIRKRLREYEQALRGGVALFEASQKVDRDEWHTYVNALQIDKQYPGIQGMGYAVWIPPTDKDTHIRDIQAEGFPDYTIRPPGERDVYTAIVYLEPFDWRNRRAFGYDMYSEPTRRAAMSRARDTGETAISGKVILVQETKEDVQPGFLMYLPLYKKSMPIATVEQRQLALQGYVYSPFRIRDLMVGILGQGLPEMDFEIFDGRQINEQSLLYVSDDITHGQLTAKDDALTATEPLEFGGHTWTIFYKSNDDFDAATRTSQPVVVAFGGVVIDLLLFYIIISLANLRKQALALAQEREDKLLLREGQFKAITDSAREGIVSMDASGLITYVNGAVEEMFGQRRESLNNHLLVDLLAPQFRKRVNNAITAQQAVDTLIEVTALRADGSEFPLEISLSKWTAAGQAHASAMLRDLTERKRIDRMKNEFVSTVSHELRTPLTSIRGSLGLINGVLGDTLDDNTRNMLVIANNNAERLSRLVNDILDIEKMDSGQMQFDLRELALCPLLKDAIEANTAMSEQAHVELVLAHCDDVTVQVDDYRFLQVMANLLSNAIKFSPAGAAVEVSAARHNNMVRITVSDHGPGIPEEFRGRIFMKFAQADSSATRMHGGSGLGLSIVKAIIEQFGGEIDYSSDGKRGSHFFFDLPISRHGNSKAGP